MDIYVAYLKRDGRQGWLCNPKPLFTGKCILYFTPVTVSAGICTGLCKNGSPSKFRKALQDELDQLGIPWSGVTNPRVCVRAIKGEKYEFYMMDLAITGPLPLEVVLRTQGTKTKKPVKVMVRYGG